MEVSRLPRCLLNPASLELLPQPPPHPWLTFLVPPGNSVTPLEGSVLRAELPTLREPPRSRSGAGRTSRSGGRSWKASLSAEGQTTCGRQWVAAGHSSSMAFYERRTLRLSL